MSYINIGGAYTLLKNYKDALTNFVIAEQLCIKNEERPLLKDLYWSMSQCYAQSNNKTLAYDYLLKHKVIADSIQSKEISQNILDILQRIHLLGSHPRFNRCKYIKHNRMLLSPLPQQEKQRYNQCNHDSYKYKVEGER